MASKRPFSFPVGDSPGKPKTKIPACPEARTESSSRKSLFTSEQSVCLSKKPVPWSGEETKCLVRYVHIGKMPGPISGHW